MGEMQAKSDAQLLRDYAERRDEAAFRELVARSADLVYSAALRQVESSAVAGDIAQSVFTDLARKAAALAEKMPAESSLAGWLHRATRYAALNHLRDARRLRTNERQAMEQLLTNSESAADWERIRPALDEALDSLDDQDREALLLRYFKNQDFRAVGHALGVSDDAAQKRVSRAVERLREFFSKRKITVGAGGLAVLISANAVQSAPVGLVATISAAALSGAAVSTSTIIATTTKTIAMTAIQKTLITATLAVIAGAGIFEARQNSKLREQNQILQQQQVPLAEQIQQLQRQRDDATNRSALPASTKSNNEELLKLRGEIGVLRRQLEWQKENTAHSSAASAPGTAQLPPIAYVSKSQLTNAGFATPEDAIQTYMHAILSGNYDQLVGAFSASTPPPDFTNDPQKREEFEKATRGEAASFLGQQILAKKAVGDNRVDLEVLVFQAGKFPDTTIQRMVKEGNQWKFAGSYGVEPPSGSDDQIQLFAPSVVQ